MCAIVNPVECQTQLRNGEERTKTLGNHSEPQDVKTMAESGRKKKRISWHVVSGNADVAHAHRLLLPPPSSSSSLPMPKHGKLLSINVKLNPNYNSTFIDCNAIPAICSSLFDEPERMQLVLFLCADDDDADTLFGFPP